VYSIPVFVTRYHSCRQLVSVAVRDHLVPACPHEKEKKCGTVPQPMAERALNVWLDSGSTRAGAAAIARASSTSVQSMAQRKSELDGWGTHSDESAQRVQSHVSNIALSRTHIMFPHASSMYLHVVNVQHSRCGVSCRPPIQKDHHLRPDRLHL